MRHAPTRRLAALVLGLGLTLGLALTPSAAGAAGVTTLCGQTAAPPATWSHVIWIWMENHSFNQVIGSSSAPFENQLATACGLATNYHNVTHPSLPNYIAATSGNTQGLTSDCLPSQCPQNVASVFAQMTSAGKTWRAYDESMPSNCDKSNSGEYAPKHNPAVYYTPIASACATSDVPMGTTTSGNFLHDLTAATLPSFSFVTPNLCNDTHDCSVATGDSWLSGWFNVIAGSAAYQAHDTAIVVVWDEGSGGSSGADCSHNTTSNDCHIPAIVVAPSTPRGTTSGTLFNHYSLLGTTEQMLGISTLLGHAGDANNPSMRSAFNL
jgi:phospholipase C